MTVVAALLALVVTVVFLFVLRPVAAEVGLVDSPGGRKRHTGHIPLIGGLAMSIGLGFGSSLTVTPEFWHPVLLGIYLLVAVGTIDDRYELSPSVRLVAQTCAAMIVVFGSGMVIAHLGTPLFFDLPLGPVAAIFTVLFIITVVNAYNMVDGLDGLAGGLSLVALAGGAAITYQTSLFPLVVLLMMVVSGFLLFNLPFTFNRGVRVFMGDAGSTSLGLAIAALGVALCNIETVGIAVAPVVGLWLIAVPVYDLFSAIVRRLAEGRSPFEPDHEHLHHSLQEYGLSRRATLVFMLALSALLASIGVMGHVYAVSDTVMMLGWFGCGALYYQLVRRPDWLLGKRRGFVGD